MNRKLFVASCIAFVAYAFAKALHVPDWRNWDIGDATDIAITTWFAVFYLMDRPKTQESGQ